MKEFGMKLRIITNAELQIPKEFLAGIPASKLMHSETYGVGYGQYFYYNGKNSVS